MNEILGDFHGYVWLCWYVPRWGTQNSAVEKIKSGWILGPTWQHGILMFLWFREFGEAPKTSNHHFTKKHSSAWWFKTVTPWKNRNRPETLDLHKCREVRHGKDRCVCARMLATDRCFWEGRESWDLKIWRPNLTVGWAKQPFWLLDMSLIHPAETTNICIYMIYIFIIESIQSIHHYTIGNQLSDCQGTQALGETFDRQFERWWFATHESWLIRWGFPLQCFRWERCGKWQEMVGKSLVGRKTMFRLLIHDDFVGINSTLINYTNYWLVGCNCCRSVWSFSCSCAYWLTTKLEFCAALSLELLCRLDQARVRALLEVLLSSGS